MHSFRSVSKISDLDQYPEKGGTNADKVVVEQLPWATGKSPAAKEFAAFPARRARKLSWTDTAKSFRVSWDIVADAVT